MADSIEETKVYYPDTIPDVELPDQVSYAQVIGAPQSVSDLNTIDGKKLEAITYNAGNPYWINDVINARIDTASKNILADWNFGDTDYAGGVYAGDISWNSATGAVTGGSGVVINRSGIIGASGGSTTFAIDATTGDAVFSGDITASTVTGGTITGATITGGTIRTASSGARVQMLSSTNTLQILDSSSVVRAESYSNGWQFNNSVGSARGRVFVENTFGNLQLQAVSADLFLTAASDITFAPGNGSISMYIDATSKDLVMNSGDLVLGNTTIAGGGSWTLTLPSTNGSPGQYLQTDGSGNTTWATVSGGANTSLSNLSSVAINADLVPGSSLIDIGDSLNYWDRLYVDDIYLNSADGGIYYNSTLSLDFYSAHIRLGSSMDDFSPASSLGANFGSTFRWQAGYFDTLDVNGTVDASSFRFSTGEDITGNGNVIEYDADTDHIFYINSVLKAIIDNNIYTEGDLLAGGSKPFLIAHPDGSDRLLRYTAQESPEVLLRHRGEATTGPDGSVTITFPEHFKLVTDPTGQVTVNLTPFGDNIVYLADRPTNASMIVASQPGVTFHFEVIAVRNGFKDQAVEIAAGDSEGLHAKMADRINKSANRKQHKAAITKAIQDRKTARAAATVEPVKDRTGKEAARAAARSEDLSTNATQ